MNSPESIYHQRISDFSGGIGRLRKPLRWIPWVRLFLFITTGFLVFYAFKFQHFLFILAPGFSFAGFLLAGWYDSNLKTKIKKLETLLQINRQELLALGGDFSSFEPGDRFVNQDHPYSHDLDVFGKGSLFQHINRTSTDFGQERLADYFNHAYHYSNEILLRQNAIAELAANIDFRQQLQLIFFNQETSVTDLIALNKWLDGKWDSKWRLPLKVVSWVLPLFTLSAIVFSAAGLVSYQIPVFLVTLQILVVFTVGRRLQVVQQAVSSQVGIFRKYAMAFSLAEAVTFITDYNCKLQGSLRQGERGMPGQVIGQLSKLMNMLDSNLNMLVSVILNGLFMFNLHILDAVERWREKYRDQVPGWFKVLAEIDALSSLGNFAFNHPDFSYPKPYTESFRFSAEKMGHPLIPAEMCVTNDIEIMGWNQFRIITGANMSGKSTFLRTIGTNLLLAMMGAPVFAQRLIFYPVEIHSSIRTNDSLAKRESYFYAELRRLKEIIGELESGKNKLILLDEILKGTNSSDKQTGSIALIKQLMKFKISGLIATHDLALGDLIRHYPENIRNLCFEIQIKDDKMEIDYKLSPGICRNLNASFLMKNMGIILE